MESEARGDVRARLLEQRLEALEGRVALLEQPSAGVRPVAPTRSAEPARPAHWLPPRPLSLPVEEPRAERAPRGGDLAAALRGPRVVRERETSLEDLLGGRVLAWVGGLAVFVGIVLLLAIAVSHGWIGEGARTLLAAAGAGGLLLGGVWLHERTARTAAARAAAAAGIAGLFATTTVASAGYELIPAVAGVLLALLVGAAATALALRWDSRGIAALGILGGIAAPLLDGLGHDAAVLAILGVALAAAAGVLLWQRWDWLAPVAFALAAPQWVASMFGDGTATAGVLATLVAFGGLGVALAVGGDLCRRDEGLRGLPALLLALNALVLAVAGWAAFANAGDTGAGRAWLVALALVHLAVGLAGPRLGRVSDGLRLLSLLLGALLADVAFALLTDGMTRTLGWAAAGVGFALLQRRLRAGGRDEAFLLGGLGGHLALTLVQALVLAQPVQVLQEGAALSGAGAAAVVALAAACLTAGWLVERETWRTALHGCGLAAIALLSALLLDGPALVLAWAAEAVVLVRVAARFGDRAASAGALAFLALAALHALVVEAPPESLAQGFASTRDALPALCAVAGAAFMAAAWLPGLSADARTALRAAGPLTLLYLASGLVVTAFSHGALTAGGTLGVHQQGQLALSVLWAVVGVATLAAGLQRDERGLRLAALALLGVTIGKVFLFDLQTLTSVYRVVSFVALGLLLLIGALAWQRARPQEGATGR